MIEVLFDQNSLPDLLTELAVSDEANKRAIAVQVVQRPGGGLVRAVTLTGSTPAGKAVASQAGAVLKKTVLELGGSDAYIVLEDADLESAATTCVNSRLINGGQSCIAAKRFIVVQPIVEAFTKRFVEIMKSKRVGDPLAAGTDVGPQARHDLRDALHKQVTDSMARGARVLCGGEIPENAGAYYPPTVLTDIKPGMPAFDEEMFGPVAAIIVIIYFGIVRSHPVLGFASIVALGVVLVWTAPNRWGAGIALHYLSRVYWPDASDPVPSQRVEKS